jgi:hypothetical protein
LRNAFLDQWHGREADLEADEKARAEYRAAMDQEDLSVERDAQHPVRSLAVSDRAAPALLLLGRSCRRSGNKVAVSLWCSAGVGLVEQAAQGLLDRSSRPESSSVSGSVSFDTKNAATLAVITDNPLMPAIIRRMATTRPVRVTGSPSP